jgi:quinol monooxygenase YgiN
LEQIHINAVFPNIDPARIDEFKALAAELLEITNGDPGTVRYDWYLSDDNTRCVLRETYADSAAVLAHLPLVNDHLTRIAEISGGIEADILGDPSPELQAMMDGTGAKSYRYLQGK